MLDFVFIKREKETVSFEMEVNVYKKVIESGIGEVTSFENKEFIIENEKYEIEVAELNYDVRTKFVEFLTLQIIKEIENIFDNIDIKSITIKEIRNQFKTLKTFLDLIKMLKDENNVYFSVNP